MNDEKDIKMCKTKTKKSQEGKALTSPLYFFERRGRQKRKCGIHGPPHMTAEDVDCTALGAVNCVPARLYPQG